MTMSKGKETRACSIIPFRHLFALFSARTSSSPPSKSFGFASSDSPRLAKNMPKIWRKLIIEHALE